MNHNMLEDSHKYAKFYLEFIDAINDPNNPKHQMALQHIYDVVIKMYTRSTLLGKTSSVNGNIGVSNVSNINFVALPLPYPRIQFERCKSTSIAILKLIDYLSQDKEFIVSNFSTLSDEFVSNLYKIYEKVYLKNSSNIVKNPKVRCYLNRSDFMIDGTTPIAKSDNQPNINFCDKCISNPCICPNTNADEWPKLIETNCIAVSNTTHSTSLSRILSAYATQQDDISAKVAKFINLAIELNEADSNTSRMNNCILVIYDSTDNVFDWGRVGTLLEDDYNYRVFYHTLLDLVKLHETGQIDFQNGVLKIIKFDFDYTVKFIYLRSGYIPKHIKTNSEWKMIEYLELCNAVKVPTIPTQLVCSKMGQMIWSSEQIMETIDSGLLEFIFSTRIDQCDPAIDAEMKDKAIKNPDQFVLKNHLEGGHGIFFNHEISETLKNGISSKEYVLSRRIFPPLQKSVFVNTDCNRNIRYWVGDSVNELGIYSFGIFRQKPHNSSDNNDENPIIEIPGYLSRTKSPEITGGGICSGFSSLSTLRLI